MDTIRLGLIGAGAIAHFTAAEFARHPAARLVAVADPSIERAGELARTFSIATACTSAAELLDRDLDAVYIAVPNVLHAPLAIAALESGRHVLLEKPFAIDLAAAERVAEAARPRRAASNQRASFVLDGQHVDAFAAGFFEVSTIGAQHVLVSSRITGASAFTTNTSHELPSGSSIHTLSCTA
jgi:hypothetical protein